MEVVVVVIVIARQVLQQEQASLDSNIFAVTIYGNLHEEGSWTDVGSKKVLSFAWRF